MKNMQSNQWPVTMARREVEAAGYMIEAADRCTSEASITIILSTARDSLAHAINCLDQYLAAQQPVRRAP